MVTKIIALLLLAFSCQVFAFEVKSPHCYNTCPFSKTTSKVIVRENYTIANNSVTKFADWVAYVVTKETIGSNCKRNWKPDPLLLDGDTLEPSDYDKSWETIHTDRGHLVPLASFCNTETWYELNYLSNITPQSSKLNRGIWKSLEDKVRKLALDGNVVYVKAGTLYERKFNLLPNADEPHILPSGYWKIVTVNGETTAYIFDQTNKNGNLKDHEVTIKEIETRSNLTLQ